MADPRNRAGSGSEDPRRRGHCRPAEGFTTARDRALVHLDPERMMLRRTERLVILTREPIDSDLMPFAILIRSEAGYTAVDLAPGRWVITPVDKD